MRPWGMERPHSIGEITLNCFWISWLSACVYLWLSASFKLWNEKRLRYEMSNIVFIVSWKSMAGLPNVHTVVVQLMILINWWMIVLYTYINCAFGAIAASVNTLYCKRGARKSQRRSCPPKWLCSQVLPTKIIVDFVVHTFSSTTFLEREFTWGTQNAQYQVSYE